MEYDTIEYIRVHKSKILNGYKNIIHLPSKVSFYKYKNSYSSKVQYIENNVLQTDSLGNYNKLFYTKNIENKNTYDFKNEYKISKKLKDNWSLLERIENTISKFIA